MLATLARPSRNAALALALAILPALLAPCVAQTGPTAAPAQTPTPITVRAIAVGGKFLGDDVGGAQISIRDVLTGELLAAGVTRGGSGPDSLMTERRNRSQPIPTEDGDNSAARFDATLLLDRARLVEVTAVGPLAAPSPGRISKTIWVYPGMSRSPDGNLRTDGLLMEIPGLVVGMVTPPVHYLAWKHDPSKPMEIRANVTMMCGCPIAGEPWPASDFEVVAHIQHRSQGVAVPLQFDANAPDGAPSQFVSRAWVPGGIGVFNISVVAYQKSTGNLGVAQSSVTLFRQ
jgi:hypothetical protein